MSTYNVLVTLQQLVKGTNNRKEITGTIPVAQWDEGNFGSPSFVWSIKDESDVNQWGSNYNGWLKKGTTMDTVVAHKGESKFLNSTGTVIMGANQAGTDSFKYDNGTTTPGTPTGYTAYGKYYAPYLNQFLNHFSWWTPQRLAMGTQLLDDHHVVTDADKYQPEVQTINGNTSQTLNDLTARNGIKDLIQTDGSTIALPSNATVSWYNSATDQEKWNSQMKDKDGNTIAEPTNPTGNLPAGDSTAWAKITYGDGSVDFANIPLHITEPTIADKQTPDGGTITVPEGHTLDNTDAANAITNKDQLKDSDGNSVVNSEDGYTWKTAPDTTIPGTKSGVVTVTYTDGSKDDVPVTVNVQSLADQNTPKGGIITVPENHTLDNTDAANAITNKNELKDSNGNSAVKSENGYTWGTAPDTSVPGTKDGVVTVTYNDGSKDEVPVKVTVTGNPSTSTKTDADKNDPQGKNIKTTIGNVPAARDGIANKDTLPSGTTYDWSQTPNVYSKGDHPAVIKVTYPDSSIDYVPTTVTVTNEPTGKNITTDPTHVPDAKTSIDWGNGTEPSDTTITWAKEPDVSQPGNTTGTAKITYPDGETTTVVVPIHVTDPGSTNTAFDPYGTTIRVPYGHELTDTDAKNGIAGGVPSDANVTYTWKYKPATSGTNIANTTQQGYVTVAGTLNNGQSVSKDVIVYVRVGDQAENYDPKGQDLTVKKGDPVPGAATAITNKNTLPTHTSYEWAYTPNTNVVGTQSTLVKVTYPDKSFDYVPVNVKVTDYSSEYPVSYGGLDIERPNDNSTATKDEMPTTTTGMPAGTIAGYQKGAFTDPTGTTITIGNDGKVTVSVKRDANRGTFNVPVKVSYQDGTSAIVYAPVSITGDEVDPGGNHTYYGNQTETTMIAVPTDVHKTSDDFTPDATKSGFNEIIYNYDWDGTSGNGNYRKHTTYKLSADGTKFVNVADPSDSFAASAIKYTWMTGYTPNTNFGDQTQTVLAKNPDGSFNSAEQTGEGDNLPGNSKYRVNVTIGDTSITAKLGLGFRPYSSWNNVYFNFYGAKSGDVLTFKQNSDISNLSQDQYRQLIDVTDLGKDGWNGTNINPNAPQVLAYVPGTDAAKTFAMIWAPNGQPSTANVADSVSGKVRILFNDGTYLDVPATIKVVKDDNAGKPDTDKTSFNQKISYQYNGQEVSSYVIPNIPKGSTLTHTQLADYINNNLPANYSIDSGHMVWPGDENNIRSTPATIIVPLKQSKDQHDHSHYNATVGIKYVDDTDPTHPQPLQTKDGKDQIQFTFNKNDGLKANVLKNAIDTNIPTNWKLAPGFTYPDDQTGDNTITVPLVHATKDINPDDPGVDPTNDKYKDLFAKATRKIYQTQPGQTSAQLIETQTIQFGRSGVEDLVTGEVTGTGSWKVGKIENNKFSVTVDGSSDFAKFDAPQITDYDSYVDGAKATSVSSKSALSSDGQPTDAPDVYISYLRSGDHTTPVPFVPNDKDDEMNHYVTRTIIVYKTDGKTQPISQPVHFGRDGVKDQHGNTTWNPWKVVNGDGRTLSNSTTGTWHEYDVDHVDGYDSTVDGQPATKVEEKTVNADTPSITVTVAYTRQLKPDDPSINPNNPGENDDMYAHPTRTIHVINPDGSTKDTVQTVWFGRTKTVSTDPNVKPVYGDWQLGKVEGNKFVIDPSAPSQWGEFTAPTITGYTAHPASVDAQTVTPETKDTIVNITYTKDGDNTNPPKPDEPGNNDKPDKPGDNTNPDKKPDDNTNKTPDDNNNNGTPDNTKKHHNKGKKNKKHIAKNTNSNNGSHPEANDNGSNNGAHGEDLGNEPAKSGALNNENTNVHGENTNNGNNANNEKQTLPQTGSQDTTALGAIGLAIASLGSLFGLGAGKKRKN